MLLVLLVLVYQSLAVLLIRQQYLRHRQIFYRLIEVIQSAEGLSTSRERLVVHVALLGVPVIEAVVVFEDACAVIDDLLPHLQTNPRQSSVRIERQHVFAVFEGGRIVVVGTLVEALLQAIVTQLLQPDGLLSVSLSLFGSIIEVCLHGLESGIVLGHDRFFFFLRDLVLRVRLEDVPLLIVGTALSVEHLLCLLPIVPLCSSLQLLRLLDLVLLKLVSKLSHSVLQK